MSTRSTSKKIITFTVLGEACSKANSRRLVTLAGKPRFIKSKKALDYVYAFSLQCPQLNPVLEEDLSVTMTIYYASRRPDLDESVILDCMQTQTHRDKKTKVVTVLRNNIYKNDRQVKQKHIFWALDKENPRAEISIEAVTDTEDGDADC